MDRAKVARRVRQGARHAAHGRPLHPRPADERRTIHHHRALAIVRRRGQVIRFSPKEFNFNSNSI